MRYYISDLHFGHANLNTRMDNRGFESVEAMNQYMIQKWNSRVRKKDEVVIIGEGSINSSLSSCLKQIFCRSGFKKAGKPAVYRTKLSVG